MAFDFKGISSTLNSITWEITVPDPNKVYQVQFDLFDAMGTSGKRYLKTIEWTQQGELTKAVVTEGLSYDTLYLIDVRLYEKNGLVVQTISELTRITFRTANTAQPSLSPTDLRAIKVGNNVQFGWEPGQHNHWFRFVKPGLAPDQWRTTGYLINANAFIYTQSGLNLVVGSTYTLFLETENNARTSGGSASVTYTHVDTVPAPIDFVHIRPGATRGSALFRTRSVGATSFRIEHYRKDDNSLVRSQTWSVTTTAGVLDRKETSLPEWTELYVLVYGINGVGETAPYRLDFILPYQSPPTITILDTKNQGELYMKWSIETLLEVPEIEVYIGTEGGGTTTLQPVERIDMTLEKNLELNSYKWQKDANGDDLIADGFYYVAVRAWDEGGRQSARVSRQLQFKLAAVQCERIPMRGILR